MLCREDCEIADVAADVKYDGGRESAGQVRSLQERLAENSGIVEVLSEDDIEAAASLEQCPCGIFLEERAKILVGVLKDEERAACEKKIERHLPQRRHAATPRASGHDAKKERGEIETFSIGMTKHSSRRVGGWRG